MDLIVEWFVSYFLLRSGEDGRGAMWAVSNNMTEEQKGELTRRAQAYDLRNRTMRQAEA